MKVGLLIGSRMALPAFMELARQDCLAGVATSQAARELEPLISITAASSQILFSSLTNGDELNGLALFIEQSKPHVVFVMGFPKKITSDILNKVPGGFYNFHPGKLPEMRGPDPIFEVIYRGFSQTYFTVLKMNDEWDAGVIVAEQPIPLSPGITYGMLTTQAAHTFQSLASQLIAILNKGLLPVSKTQNPDNAAYWKRRTMPDFFIDWERQQTTEIIQLLNACNPVLKGAATTINQWRIGILIAETHGSKHSNEKAGTILSISKQEGILVSCINNDVLQIRVVYTEEGIIEAYRLIEYGIQKSMKFQSLPQMTATV